VGVASGLLGVGGGFILVPTLFLLMSVNGIDSVLALKISLGTSLGIIFPTAIFSAYNHYRKSKFDIKLGLIFGGFGLIGGLIGGLVAINSDSEALKNILGIVFILIALNMIFKPEKKSDKRNDSENLKLDSKLNLKKLFYGGTLGIGVGFLSGLLSLGGGIFIIPILTLLLGFSMIEAIKTSTIFISITAIGGLIPYLLTNTNSNNILFLVGYVNILYLLIIIFFSIPTTYIGVKLAYKINEKMLKKILALVLIYLSLKLIGIV
jgi:uncharacterized membrane protein YfcA